MGVLECHQLTPLNKMVELKNLRMSRCKFGGINISPANFTPMKKIFLTCNYCHTFLILA